MTLKHAYVNPIADDPVAAGNNETLPSHWNAEHEIATSLQIPGPSSNTANYVTVIGSATTVAPIIEASGSDASVPLQLKYKGNQGFVQAGRDTYGAAGWAGFDVNVEVYQDDSLEASSYGVYIEKKTGDFANAVISGYYADIRTPGIETNGAAQIYGTQCYAISNAPVGITHGNAWAVSSVAGQNAAGTLTEAIGVKGQIAVSTGTIVGASALRALSPVFSSGTITTLYGIKVDDQTVGVTNYNCWFGAGLYHYDALTASNWVFTDASKNLISKTNAQAAALILSANMVITQLTGVIDGGGGAIAANATTVCIPCTYAGTIAAYTITVDTGTCTVKTWKKATGTAIPTVADNISTAGVAIASGTVVRSTVVTDFTTLAVAANDLIIFTLSAVSGVTKFSFTLELTKTI